MTATPKSNSSAQRPNRAYVEVPPSDSPGVISNTRISVASPHVASSSKVKENTPFRHPNMLVNQQSSPSMSLKRKLSSAQFPEVVITSVPKKSKLSTKTNIADAEGAKEPNTSSDYPHGYVYCHQCNKKRDALTTVQCTSVHIFHSGKDQTRKERNCHNKYCHPCLKNRYDDTVPSSKFNVEGKDFKCPKCRDICNCPRCRKSKGLDATGALPKLSATEPAKPSKTEKKTESKKSKAKATPKLPPAKPSRPLPSLKWRRVPVQLSQQEAEERIFIREFVMRFSPLFEPGMSKTSVEELKLITGKSKRLEEDDFNKEWVSEMCVRAILLGLLGLLAKSAGSEAAKVIRSFAKDLRAAGANLNKIWSTLESLREIMKLPETFPEGEPSMSLNYPDPLPPPPSLISNGRNLRSIHQSDNAVNVIHSTQFIPVILSIMETSLETPVVREEIELGVKDVKDCVRDFKEAARLEQERWDAERKTMEKAAKSDKAHKEENRIKRTRHKDHITNLDNAIKVLAPSYAPRFTPLGADTDGRVYFALSSSLAEREAAEEFLESAMSSKRISLKKKGGILSWEERHDLRDWSWFIAVWGKKAPTSQPTKANQMQVDGDSEDEVEDDDETVEKWWAFWEPEEIRKVASWVAIKAGLDDEDASTPGSASASAPAVNKVTDPATERYQTLVQGLKDYAGLLDWRAVEDKYRVLK